jgi:hypothetical protein
MQSTEGHLQGLRRRLHLFPSPTEEQVQGLQVTQGSACRCWLAVVIGCSASMRTRRTTRNAQGPCDCHRRSPLRLRSTHTYMNTHRYTKAHVRTHIYTNYTFIHTDIHTHNCTRARAHTHTHTHRLSDTHTNQRTHTHGYAMGGTAVHTLFSSYTHAIILLC